MGPGAARIFLEGSGVLKFLYSVEFKDARDRLQKDDYNYMEDGNSPQKHYDQLIVLDRQFRIEEIQDRGVSIPTKIIVKSFDLLVIIIVWMTFVFAIMFPAGWLVHKWRPFNEKYRALAWFFLLGAIVSLIFGILTNINLSIAAL
jgi:hypothetical protein